MNARSLAPPLLDQLQLAFVLDDIHHALRIDVKS